MSSLHFINVTVEHVGVMLTDNAARLHSVLVDLHQVVGQVAQLWPHTLRMHSASLTTQLKIFSVFWIQQIHYHFDL